eukprot:167270-Alexandrium_andersonii.AAC.1
MRVFEKQGLRCRGGTGRGSGWGEPLPLVRGEFARCAPEQGVFTTTDSFMSWAVSPTCEPE